MRIGLGLEGPKGLYSLDLLKTCLAAMISSTVSVEKWHYRLDHVSIKT